MNRVHGQQQAEHFGSAMSKPTQAALNRAGERARLGTGNLFSPVRLDTPLMRIHSCGLEYHFDPMPPKGTSGLDPAPNPPSPDADGAFVEPTCRSPTRASPGIWPWCNRHNPPSGQKPERVVRVRRPH